jgi:hypothetical protein
MPKLWLANIEEVFGGHTPAHLELMRSKVNAMAPRNLFHADPGDALIVSRPISETFNRFVARLYDDAAPPFIVFHPDGPLTGPLALMCRNDARLLTDMRNLVSRGNWALEPYIESPEALALAVALGIPLGKNPAGLVAEGIIQRLNDKVIFKEMTQKLGIPVIPGSVARSVAELHQAIVTNQREGLDRLMLRRAQSGGGLGNTSGSPAELLTNIESLYGGEPTLVEPFMPFTHTLGSLVEVTPAAVRFRGIDAQAFDRGCWVGFEYPAPGEFGREVETWSLAFAEQVRAMGISGYVNLDWGIFRDTEGNPGITAIEANVRHNGLSLILDFGRRFFGEAFAGLRTLFLDNVALPDSVATFEDFLALVAGHPSLAGSFLAPPPIAATALGLGAARLAEMRKKAGERGGFVPILPPAHGRCGIALFAPTAAELQRLHAEITRSLS